MATTPAATVTFAPPSGEPLPQPGAVQLLHVSSAPTMAASQLRSRRDSIACSVLEVAERVQPELCGSLSGPAQQKLAEALQQLAAALPPCV